MAGFNSLVFLMGHRDGVFARFCNKDQREKSSKLGVCDCLGAADLNLNKRFAEEETSINPS